MKTILLSSVSLAVVLSSIPTASPAQRVQTGEHSVRFIGTGSAGGAYFYGLTSGSRVETKELQLIR